VRTTRWARRERDNWAWNANIAVSTTRSTARIATLTRASRQASTQASTRAATAGACGIRMSAGGNLYSIGINAAVIYPAALTTSSSVHGFTGSKPAPAGTVNSPAAFCDGIPSAAPTRSGW
jgi:hypothetical protein